MTALKIVLWALVMGVPTLIVALLLASRRQASRFGRHLDTVLAGLELPRQTAAAATSTVEVATPVLLLPPPPPPRARDGDVVLGTVVATRELAPPAPDATSSTTSGHQDATTTHRAAQLEAHMGADTSTRLHVNSQEDGFGLRWELANLVSCAEQFSRDFAASPYATAAGSERARRALAHLAAVVGELDGLSAELDMAIGPGRGGAR